MKIQQLIISLVITMFVPFAMASHFYPNDISVEVIDGYGQRLSQYSIERNAHHHSGATIKSYLEARAGHSYAIKVTNNSSERVAMVIAVDGRNIITGKHSKLKHKERKYVLEPYQQAVYRGWRTSKNRVNEFYFTEAENSYSAAFGDYSAMGVIAVAVFRDKDRHRYDNYQNDHYSSKRTPSAGSSRAERDQSTLKSQPGTGYGDEQYSSSRRVHFNPERHASAKFLLKYEWEQTLCEKGIKRCYTHHNNRLWHDKPTRRYSWDRSTYAPPPPRRYHYRSGN